MTENPVKLPKSVGAWTKPDSVKIVDSNTIFKYMNGGGELYLAYRFSHIEIYEYTAEQQENILVEVYVMDTSSDAFGLLSLDWGGEAVSFTSSALHQTAASIAPQARAMYGGGLLRMAADTLFARVMAFRETPESRKAVLSLGQAIAENRKPPAEPELLKILPETMSSTMKLRKDRIGYFRSHLVLNSLYYLSHQNILNLDLSTEAVTAPYEFVSENKPHKHVQFLLVKYTSPGKAQQALNKFHNSYLPDHKTNFKEGSKTTHTDFFRIEDGWLGYTLDSAWFSIVFECADKESARMILNTISFETPHEGGGNAK